MLLPINLIPTTCRATLWLSLLAHGATLAQSVPAPHATNTATPAQWSERLRTDANAMHQAILENHPGPVDTQNPQFRALLDHGLQQALTRADSTRDFGGYWWALREYQASFDDGHLQLATKPEWSPTLPMQWPGFLTGYSAGQQQVMARDEAPGNLPALGAELVSCDGVDANALAERQVGHFRGRWFLDSQRSEHAGRLFVDAGNPWLQRPTRCQFREAGQLREFALQWRELPAAQFDRVFPLTQASAHTGVDLRATYGNDGLWISLGRFDGQPGSEAYTQLEALMTRLGSDHRLEAADFVVLDVRGNGGGSSHWSRRVAEQLWGSARVQGLKTGSDAVDWRASAGNLQSIEDFRLQLAKQSDADPQVVAWASEVTTGLRGALEQHQALWHQSAGEDEDTDTAPAQPARLKADARVYVIADGSCASACLDALDVWKALGAVQLGTTTSADTVYMEVRGHRLPSGLAGIGVPMKVYRGRPRGHNQPYAPDIRYDGRLDDDLALEAWVLGVQADAPARAASASTAAR